MTPILDSNSFASLPVWAIVAFLARCGSRILPLYYRDSHEPLVQRIAVAQAMELAELRAAVGGDFQLDEPLKIGEQYVDTYDITALERALSGCVEAASYTHDDCELVETGAILAVASIAQSALVAAFGSSFGNDYDARKLASEATSWAVFSDAMTQDAVRRDHQLLVGLAKSEGWDDKTPVPKRVLGDLWPAGRPSTHPPMELSFRPRARIIRTIGDRLISGPEAAVIELIKNSHDADASFVRITFFPPFEGGEGCIEVEDDGHGMSLNDIENKWMEPATSDKRVRKVSPNGRKLLGSKGIGRFAAARLGRYLELQSTAQLPSSILNYETTRVFDIDWNAFDAREYLEDVKFKVESLPPARATGTRLKISSLRDDWTKSQLGRLHEELRRLISPVAYQSGEKAFRVFLDLSRYTEPAYGFDGAAIVNSSSVQEPESSVKQDKHEVLPFPVLEACDYAVDGVFDETGNFEGTMTVRRGELEPEKVTLRVPLQSELGEVPCGIVLVRLYIFDREADSIRKTALKAGFGEIGVREARKLLDSICGVAIYREGFRIRPYGDGENDWLTLDALRVQNPSIKIGRNQIAGIVTVDGEDDSHLVERSSREGLEENGAFKRLHSLISSLLSEAVEPRRRQFRVGAGLEERNRGSFQDVYRQIQLGWSKVLLAKIPEVDRAAAEELVAKESDRLTAYIKRLEARQASLEAKVTAGLIIGEVMHQGNTPLSFVETEAARLDRWWPTLMDGTTESEENRVRVPRIISGLKSSGEKLRALFDALSPLSGARRGSPKVFDPALVIDQTVFLFRSRMERIGIRYAFVGDPTGRKVVGYPEDLSTAITNLVDNAIYWLEYHQIDDPQITISMEAKEHYCVMRIKDNGRGVPVEFADQIFDVGFTLKPNGTGIGLSIAAESMSRSNGNLQLASAVGGAIFEVSMPYEGAEPLTLGGEAAEGAKRG